MSTVSTSRFLDLFGTWASADPDVRAALLIGSRARREESSDLWSDYDIVVISNRPERLLDDNGWLSELGTPLITTLEKSATGDLVERRVLFEDGQDVDFIPVSVKQIFAAFQNSSAPDVQETFGRGFQWIVDKDRLSRLLDGVPAPQPAKVKAEDLEATILDFWYHAVWTAKKLRRGEVWVAKGCCDGYLKVLLLHVFEWYARAIHGQSYDTWFRGRFLEKWLDPEIRLRLHSIFAVYDKESVVKALTETIELFTDLTRQIAEQMHFERNSSVEERARRLMDKILDA